jgi:hypothetical protein
MTVELLTRAAAVAGLRLGLIDDAGIEVAGMDGGAVRDQAGRRFPAHLDTRHGDIDWWHGEERYSREQPWYTFDRSRHTRDRWRERSGMPEDHQLSRPGDAPEERRRRTEAEARRRWEEDIERRRAAGELPAPFDWTCECPPACADLDFGDSQDHAPGCVCQCDLD